MNSSTNWLRPFNISVSVHECDAELFIPQFVYDLETGAVLRKLTDEEYAAEEARRKGKRFFRFLVVVGEKQVQVESRWCGEADRTAALQDGWTLARNAVTSKLSTLL